MAESRYSGAEVGFGEIVLGKQLQKQLFMFMSVVGIVSAGIFGARNVIEGNLLVGWFEVGIAVIAAVNLTMVFPMSYEAASSVLVSLIFLLLPVLLLTGGLGGTGYLWYFTFLPLCFSLTRLRRALVWALASITIIILSIVAQETGKLITAYPFVELRQLLASYFVVFLLTLWRQRITLLFEGGLVKSKEEKEKIIADLEKFRLAADGASDHIVITDPDGIVLYANRGVERVTGFSREEVLHKKAGAPDLWGGLMPKEFYEKMWKTIKTERETFRGEIINRRKNGEKYAALAAISPILDKKGEVIFFVGIERDITKEKEVDRMKTEFVSLVTHQLRTPITAMRWALESLEEGDAGELNEKQTQVLRNALESCINMGDLVGSLLNISRIESGRIVVQPEMAVMKDLVSSVLTEIMPQTRETGVEVEAVSAFDSEISIDPRLIREVYKNLLTNAVKYSRSGGRVRVTIEKSGDEVISRVIDSGLGIPLSEQAHVFQKFFRASNITQAVPDGTGLGLYLVKQIVDASGGKIGFESEEGKGTTFWFSLPLSGMTAKKGEVSIS